MDVLRPKILNIDGRLYRLNTDDCYSIECNETNMDKDDTQTLNTEMSESLPSYVERDGEI